MSKSRLIHQNQSNFFDGTQLSIIKHNLAFLHLCMDKIFVAEEDCPSNGAQTQPLNKSKKKNLKVTYCC